MKYNFCHRAGMAVLAAGLLGMVVPQQASATAFVYQFDQIFDGATPAGTSPWITASFSDLSTGVVEMKISATGLTGGESLNSVLLNLDSADAPKKLSFAYVGGSGGFSVPTISTGENKFKADGNGKFDIDLAFSEKSGKTLTAGEYVIYDITSSAFTLDAMDFDALSKAAGGSGSFLAAAEISGIPTSCNSTTTGWIDPCSLTLVPVPEPASITLAVSGLGLWAGARWLASRKAKRAAR